MQKVKVKSVTRKEGDNAKGHWVNTRITGEDGSVFGTFQTGAGVIKVGDTIELTPIVKEGKTNFEEWKMVEEAPSPPVPCRETSPEEWKEKQRIERASFEAQTAFKGIIDLALAHIGAGIDPTGIDSFKDDYTLAMAWARKHLGFSPAAPLAVVPHLAEGNGGSIEIDWTPIANAGELFSRCKNYNISRDEALQIFPSPMNDFDAAWEKIVKVKFQIEKPIPKEE